MVTSLPGFARVGMSCPGGREEGREGCSQTRGGSKLRRAGPLETQLCFLIVPVFKNRDDYREM